MSDTPRLYIPALAPLYQKLDCVALPMLRIVMGAVLFPHGCQKLFGWFGGAGLEKFGQIFGGLGYHPGWLWAVLVGSTEALGGILLAVGLFTRPAALAITIFMLNAIYWTSEKGFFWTKGGSEYSIVILAVALVFLFRGGGRCSLDRAIGREF
ncbi:MAG TPA: DoxX family protein [Xanthobacteraceae bacterium]